MNDTKPPIKPVKPPKALKVSVLSCSNIIQEGNHDVKQETNVDPSRASKGVEIDLSAKEKLSGFDCSAVDSELSKVEKVSSFECSDDVNVKQ
jgi:hypothetical protein